MSTRHLDDAAVVALVGGEGSPESRRHAAECPHCSGRVDLWAGRTHRFSELLSDVDGKVDPRWDSDFLARLEHALRPSAAEAGAPTLEAGQTPHPWTSTKVLRWAAVLAVVITGAAAPPVRAFIARAASLAWTAVSGATDAPPEASVPFTAAEIGTPVAGAVLRIRIDNGGGEIELRLASRPAGDATARLTVTDRDAEVVATADGFHVTASGLVRLDVGVPAGVGEVVLYEGERESFRGPAPSGTDAYVVRWPSR